MNILTTIYVKYMQPAKLLINNPNKYDLNLKETL
jgi:hypothetical protein